MQPITGKNYQQPLYIVSAEKSNLAPKVNEKRHNDLKRQLEFLDISFMENEGRYQSTIEKSLTLMGASKLAAHHYASFYNQDSFLRLEHHHSGIYHAILVDADTSEETKLGFFRSLSKSDIDKLGLDYTQAADTGVYFTIWPTDTLGMVEMAHEIDRAIRLRELGLTRSTITKG